MPGRRAGASIAHGRRARRRTWRDGVARRASRPTRGVPGRRRRALSARWRGELPARLGRRAARRSRRREEPSRRGWPSGKVLNAIAERVPELVGGSADLGGSTRHAQPSRGPGDFGFDQWLRPQPPLRRPRARDGRDRQRHGAPRRRSSRYGATFLIFSDYMRPAIRLAALMRLPHRSSSSRTTASASARTVRRTSRSSTSRRCARCPSCTVMRPADANETVEAWRLAIARTTARSRWLLTRQSLPVLERDRAHARRRRAAAPTCSLDAPERRAGR